MKIHHDQSLREHLLYVLQGGGAHARFDDVIKDFPENLRGKKVAEVPYTAWMVLEHMRIAQWDILEFSRNGKHVSPEFPAGYWPTSDAPPRAAAWVKSIEQFRKDLREMEGLVKNPKTDLHAPLRWGDGQTVLREALLVADHNSAHALAEESSRGSRFHSRLDVAERLRKIARTPSRQGSSTPISVQSMRGAR